MIEIEKEHVCVVKYFSYRLIVERGAIMLLNHERSAD